MSKEVLAVVEIMSNEKGVDKEIIFEAIEAALATATRKSHNDELDARVSIDRHTGDYETFRRWEVVEDDVQIEENVGWYMRQMDAVEMDPHIEPGEFVEEPMESIEFGRIGAHRAARLGARTRLPVPPSARKRLIELHRIDCCFACKYIGSVEQ